MQGRFHAQKEPRLRWRAAHIGRGRRLRNSDHQHIEEGEGGVNGTAARLHTRPGGTMMPGAMAASIGGTREDRNGGKWQGGPEYP